MGKNLFSVSAHRLLVRGIRRVGLTSALNIAESKNRRWHETCKLAVPYFALSPFADLLIPTWTADWFRVFARFPFCGLKRTGLQIVNINRRVLPGAKRNARI
jgi:hypothetical protein